MMGSLRLLVLASGTPDDARRGVIPAREASSSHDRTVTAWLRGTRLRHPVIAATDIDLTGFVSDVARNPGREPALRDRDHGQWHGRPLRDLSPDDLSRWIMDPDHAAPEGESNRAVLDRVGGWMDALPVKADHLTVIARPAIVRMMLVHALGGETDMLRCLDVPPASRSVLSRHTGWRVSLMGAPLHNATGEIS